METCDVVDASGKRTGRIVARDTELGPGEFYAVVHVWIRDETGNYLIQQRAWDRVYSPGVWATTAGYVQAGEDSLPAVLREVQEELGIRLAAADLRRLGRLQIADLIVDLWLAQVTRRSIGTPVLNSEVADWRWASKAEIEESIRRGEFFEYSYFGALPG